MFLKKALKFIKTEFFQLNTHDSQESRFFWVFVFWGFFC